MKTNKIALLLGLVLVAVPLASASACDICNWRALFTSKPKAPTARQYRVVSDNEKVIDLQHPNTRRIVHCYNNNYTSSEECAQYFEKFGFVRFRDIPYKTANFDFLKVDTYPTRRWRDSELTSRW